MTNLKDIAHEISDVLSLDYATTLKEVEKEIQFSGSHVKEALLKSNPTTQTEIEDFYKNSEAYIFDLMVESEREVRLLWRSAVLTKVLSHWNNQDVSSLSMLDYGGGIGTDTIFFAQNAIHASYYDVIGKTSVVARKRFKRRKVNIPTIVNLQALDVQYDFLISFEVLEHLADPIYHLDEITKVTKAGGLVFLTDPFNVMNEDYPAHLATNTVNEGKLEALMQERCCYKIGRLEDRIDVFLKGPKVTIIVPIYNAYEDTKELLESAKQTNPGYPVQWLLCNDASPDARIDELLQSFASDIRMNVVVDSRVENLGFVQMCNAAITATSENDVILLNSDTLVYDNWVRKLVENAYSDPSIATVTPLSNNGSAFSMFQNISTTNSVNRFLNSLSAAPLTIPTGVGFCLYIKRSVIEAVGILDPVFGRGYGEETDFCQRVVKHGYCNVLAQNVFIYHKGGASMVSAGVINEGDFTIQEHEAIIAERYPTYNQEVHDFIANKTINKLDANLQQRYILFLATQRSSIALVIHVDISKPHLGGTEFHLRDLIKDLESHYVFYILSPSGENITVSITADGNLFQYTWDSKDYLGLFDSLHPHVIHIHHVKGFHPTFMNALTRWNGPKIFTIHDYFGICKSYSLINNLGNYCGVPEESVCKKCAQVLFENGYETPLEQRRLHQQLIDSTQVIIAPSQAALDVFRRGIEVPEDIVRVIPHSLNPAKLTTSTSKKTKNIVEDWQKTIATLPPSELNVGFIGYGGLQKGESIAQGIITVCHKDPINFICIGAIGNIHRKNSHVVATGNYRRQDIVTLLQQSKIDVIIMCSPWPETFSYTLSESWLAGIPVICGPLGAPASRVIAAEAGIVTKDFEISSFVRVVRSLMNDKNKLEQLRASTLQVKVTPNYAEYQDIYDDLIDSTPVTPQIISEAFIFNNNQSITIEQKSPLIEVLAKIRWSIFPIGSFRESLYFIIYRFITYVSKLK